MIRYDPNCLPMSEAEERAVERVRSDLPLNFVLSRHAHGLMLRNIQGVWALMSNGRWLPRDLRQPELEEWPIIEAWEEPGPNIIDVIEELRATLAPTPPAPPR
jgi:hypothetical protein